MMAEDNITKPPMDHSFLNVIDSVIRDTHEKLRVFMDQGQALWAGPGLKNFGLFTLWA